MRNLGRTALESFLVAIDQHLTAPCEVIAIGGAVIGLKFKGTHFTSDLDLWPGRNAEFLAAEKLVNQTHAPRVPVQEVTIASAPRDFEDRLTALQITGLKKLRVMAPEAHDLAIMKMARGVTHDLEAIEDIHRAQPLDLDTLLDRHAETDFIGPVEENRLVLFATIARIFGDDVAHKVHEQMSR